MSTAFCDNCGLALAPDDKGRFCDAACANAFRRELSLGAMDDSAETMIDLGGGMVVPLRELLDDDE